LGLYKYLNFLGEIWAGRAGVEANEEELTTCAKICGQEVGKKVQGGYNKREPRQ
jgi:hypothetical protein